MSISGYIICINRGPKAQITKVCIPATSMQDGDPNRHWEKESHFLSIELSSTVSQPGGRLFGRDVSLRFS